MKIENQAKKSNARYYLFLHILLCVYSLSGVCSKLAAKEEFLSLNFCFLYGLILLNLFVYAIVWQQILKHLNLTTAFCNKAVNIIWGLLWGLIIFQEAITWNMIVGAVIVIAGVIIVVMSDE